MGCFVAFIITTKGCAVNASFLRISAQKKRKTPSGRLLREGVKFNHGRWKAPGEVATPWGLFFLVYRMEYPHNSIFSICHSPQKSSVAQKVYRNCRTAAFHFFQSCVSFRMPNSLRSKPLRHLGLLRTTTCIEPTTFRRLIRHYRRSAPGMFRFSSKSARPAPSPPPPARPFGWRW